MWFPLIHKIQKHTEHLMFSKHIQPILQFKVSSAILTTTLNLRKMWSKKKAIAAMKWLGYIKFHCILLYVYMPIWNLPYVSMGIFTRPLLSVVLVRFEPYISQPMACFLMYWGKCIITLKSIDPIICITVICCGRAVGVLWFCFMFDIGVIKSS